MKRLSLLLLSFTVCFNIQAANYYWVGGSTTVWGATSGAWKINGFSGTPVNTIPGSSDNVFIGNGTSNSTVTLDANYTIDSLNILGSGMIFINTSTSKTLSVTGDIYVSNTNTTGGGSATIIVSGSGKQTLTNTSTVSNKGKLPSITVNKTDTLHLVGYITMGGSTTLNLTAGVIDPGTSTVSFYLSNTVTGVVNVYDAEFQGTSSTCSVTDTLRVNHNLSFTGSGYLTLNGNDIKVKGNVSMSNSSTNGSGSATVEFIGSSNQTLSSSVPEGEGFLPNIKISKSADSLKLTGVLSIRGNWTNNYSTSLIQYGTAELFCPGYNALSGMSFNGSKSTPLYDVTFYAVGFSPVFTLGKDSALIVKDSLKLTKSGGAGISLSGHSILIEGSIINNVSSLTANTSLFIIGGGNNQLIYSSVAEGSGLFPSVLIQKSGNTLTLKGTISEGSNWTNNYDTTHINYDTSTVYFGHCCGDGTQTIGGTAANLFYNLTLGGTSNCIFALGRDSAAIVKNNLKLKNGNENVIINNYHMVVRGNIAVTNTSNSSGGTTEIILAGGSNQMISSTSSRGLGYLPGIRLQKTGGTVSLSGIVSIKGNWTNNYSTSNISYAAGELYFYGGGTQSLGGTYQTPVYRLTLGGSSINTYTMGIDSAFIVKDTFNN